VEAGARPDRCVGVVAERTPETIVAVVGVLAAGAAYVPLDPLLPAARRDAMAAEAGIEVVVGGESGSSRSTVAVPQDGVAGEPPLPDPRPDQLAYVVYTSGSTGKPKGVMVDHGALRAFVDAATPLVSAGPGERMLQFSSLAFDASVEEIFTTLTRGGALVLRDEEMLASPEDFLAGCARAGVTVVDLPTNFWRLLAREWSPPREPWPEELRLVVVGGDRLPADEVQEWFAKAPPDVRLLNTYGPTEATVTATACVVTREDARRDRIPIGSPLGHVVARVLDDSSKPVGEGAVGELWLGGPGLARGYLGQPAATAAAFHDVGGERLYRTGDFVRRSAAGLEFVGRRDRQVKVRGFRVELDEVEETVAAEASVAAAAVDAVETSDGERELRAHVVAQERGFSVGELRAALRDRLPGYMLPAKIEVVEELPLTSGGKVDREALRALPARDSEGDAFADPPRPGVEADLARIWAEVLGRPVGRSDVFLDLGGDSLTAAQIAARARSTLRLELNPRHVLEAATVADLARRLAGAERRATLPPILARRK
jgi:amino acid adenylation domain-containing protein